MAVPDPESSPKDTDLNKAVRKALQRYDVPEGDEIEIKIYVTNVSNNPIHEYRVEKA